MKHKRNFDVVGAERDLPIIYGRWIHSENISWAPALSKAQHGQGWRKRGSKSTEVGGRGDDGAGRADVPSFWAWTPC